MHCSPDDSDLIKLGSYRKELKTSLSNGHFDKVRKHSKTAVIDALDRVGEKFGSNSTLVLQ